MKPIIVEVTKSGNFIFDNFLVSRNDHDTIRSYLSLNRKLEFKPACRLVNDWMIDEGKKFIESLR